MVQTLSITTPCPRLGFAYDLSGKRTSVVRGYYGQLCDGAAVSSWSRDAENVSETGMQYPVPNWTGP